MYNGQSEISPGPLGWIQLSIQSKSTRQHSIQEHTGVNHIDLVPPFISVANKFPRRYEAHAIHAAVGVWPIWPIPCHIIVKACQHVCFKNSSMLVHESSCFLTCCSLLSSSSTLYHARQPCLKYEFSALLLSEGQLLYQVSLSSEAQIPTPDTELVYFGGHVLQTFGISLRYTVPQSWCWWETNCPYSHTSKFLGPGYWCCAW